MADNHTKEQRSRNMASIRSFGNETTEIRLIKIFRANKINGWRRRVEGLPGRPDFVFPGSKIAVFADGCFWHGCATCKLNPKSNQGYWKVKIERNKKRDRLVTKALKDKNWIVVRVWEHEIKDDLKKAVAKVVAFIKD